MKTLFYYVYNRFWQCTRTCFRFLERNNDKLKGVSASGNRNWGDMFGASADKISTKYEVPIVSKI